MASVTVSIGATLAWAMNCERELVRGVELAGHHRGDAAGILRHDLDHQLLELHRPLVLVHRGAPLVGVVALQHDLRARLPGLEAPRAGAVGALDAVILAQRLDIVLVEDGVGEHGELQQQLGERLGQLVLDGVGIGRAQLLDVAGAPGEGALDLRALQPLEGEDHVLGGELLAAAEGDVVAQLEGVELAVGADGPRLGEIGDRRRPSQSSATSVSWIMLTMSEVGPQVVRCAS